jgi:predicted thioesterase
MCASEDLNPIIGIATLVVRASDTSLAQGSNDLNSVSTSTLVALAEAAVQTALNDRLSTSESSLTTRCECFASDIAGVGSELYASAKCISHEGSQYLFSIAISHDELIIATGEIERKVIDRVTISAKIAARSRR